MSTLTSIAFGHTADTPVGHRLHVRRDKDGSLLLALHESGEGKATLRMASMSVSAVELREISRRLAEAAAEAERLAFESTEASIEARLASLAPQP